MLQAKSLQTYLDSLSVDSEIVNYESFTRRKLYAIRGLKDWRQRVHALTSIPSQIRKIAKFDDYRAKSLNCSAYVSSAEGLVSELRKYSHLIVGSDQVWNPKYGEGAVDAYTLNYPNILAKRISYAACVGSSSVNTYLLQKSNAAFDEFSAISTRDEFSKKLIQELTGNESITKVLDPSFLIDWNLYVLSEGKPDLECGDYILVYGFSREIFELVEYLARKYPGRRILAIGMEGEFFLSNRVEHRHDVGPSEWIRLMHGAAIIVTKSFHGFSLAVNLNKELYFPITSQRSMDRITDLCDTLEIDESHTSEIDCDFGVIKVLHVIEYEQIREVLDRRVSESKGYLMANLSI
nr:polysaccharide pyruvyl transferase family protein [Pseudohongiella sp. O18]